MKILQESSRVNTETSRFHFGSASVALLCHRSDKYFSPETNRPEPEAGPQTIAEKTEHTEEFSQKETEVTEGEGLAAKKRKKRKIGRNLRSLHASDRLL